MMFIRDSKYKKQLLALSVATLAVGIFIYTRQAPNPTEEAEIQRNNTNQTAESDTEVTDLSTLEAKEVIIPEKFREGVFSQSRFLNLPNGFEISVFDAGYTKARGMDFDEEDRLYVTDSNLYTVKPKGGEVFVVVDSNGDGIADQKNLVEAGLQTPHGIDYYQGDLYVGEEGQVIVYRNIQEDGSYSLKEVLIENLPTGGGHVTRTVVISADEKIYVSVGSSCNVCEEGNPKRSAILKYNLDGSGEEIHAEGLRNTVGMAFDKQGTLWGVNNGRDRLGDDLPGEEVNIIQKGNHYGWPYCYGNGVVDTTFSGREDFCKNQTTNPTYQMQAHSAPLGIAFYPNETRFPQELNNNMFITFHGSWNRTVPTGYKVVRINSNDTNAQTVNFITGWLKNDGNAWGRPVDVKFDSRGDMYISDDEAGAIYKVTYTAAQ